MPDRLLGRIISGQRIRSHGGMDEPRRDFAVVDLETTGLFPGRGDRIVELAVVRTTPDGDVVGEWATLVNPGRDIGPTNVHGIWASDVMDAPEFSDVVGDVALLLRDAVFVSHNVLFDLRFFAAEFERLGYSFPSVPSLCTLQLSSRFARSASSRRLAHCCEAFEIPVETAHAALSDARATSRLLLALLREAGVPPRRLEELGVALPGHTSVEWPPVAPSGRSLGRDSPARSPERSYLAGLVERLPVLPGETAAPAARAYLDVLDRALEDRMLSEGEVDALGALAEEWGLGSGQLRDLHDEYLATLVGLAVADGVVTEGERRDLERVARLLGEDAATVGRAMEAVSVGTAASAAAPVRREEMTGKSVCFTGEMTSRLNREPITRALAERLAMEAGMIVKDSVTKKLDLLVTADPDSLSGKARKAREYGTRVVAERSFWKALGLRVE